MIKSKKFINFILQEGGIGLVLVVIIVVFSFAAPRFATVTNFSNIMQQISINTAISVGMTYVILLGGIDLSVGSSLALATILAGKAMIQDALPAWAAIGFACLAGVGISMLCGLFNGFVSVLILFIITAYAFYRLCRNLG